MYVYSCEMKVGSEEQTCGRNSHWWRTSQNKLMGMLGMLPKEERFWEENSYSYVE